MAASSEQYLSGTETLDIYQESIRDIIEDGQTDAQIIATLSRRGVQISERSLRRRLQI
jgi:hypothetical protein